VFFYLFLKTKKSENGLERVFFLCNFTLDLE